MLHVGMAEPSVPADSASGGTWHRVVWLLVPVGSAAALGLLVRPHLASVDLAMLLLLAVVVVASRTTPLLAAMAALLAITAFDILFVPPYYTFSVADSAYLLTFAVMFGVALAVGQLTTRLRSAGLERQRREQLSARLLAMTDELGRADSLVTLASAGARHLADATGRQARVLLAEFEEDLALEEALALLAPEPADHGVRDALLLVHEHRAPQATSVDGWSVVAIGDLSHPRGFALIAPGQAIDRDEPMGESVTALLERYAALVDRTRWRWGEARARLEIEGERLRSALLSSVSHDLRSPLAAIEGAASTLLLEPGDSVPPAVRAQLLETIQEEAQRMNRLIGNLLDMVRVQSGSMVVHASWQPIDEVVGAAIRRLGSRLERHPLSVKLPESLPLVHIDELLLEQVFINLLDNAVRHTPPATPVLIRGRREGGRVEIEVCDRGPGVGTTDDPDLVFTKFHRAVSSGMEQADGGLGLGLTICRGVLMAHGGTIHTRVRRGGGAAFRLSIPVGEPPHPPDEPVESFP